MAQRPQVNLNKVIEAAVAIANTSGYEQLALASIAKALGIKTPSLYNHVNGLPELRQKMACHGLNQLYESVLHAVVGFTGKEAIMRASQAYVAFVETQPGLYSAISKVPLPEEAQFDELSNRLVQLMLKLFEGYDLTVTERIHAVRGLRSFLHGFAAIQMDIGFRLGYSQEESFTFVIETFLKGLSTDK